MKRGRTRTRRSLHARSVAMSAGAPPESVEALAALLVTEGEVRVERAQELLEQERTAPDSGEAPTMAARKPPSGSL